MYAARYGHTFGWHDTPIQALRMCYERKRLAEPWSRKRTGNRVYGSGTAQVQLSLSVRHTILLIL
jgi:hypothetical protein